MTESALTRRSNCYGFTLIEVLVALTLAAIGISSLAAGFSAAMSATKLQNDRNHALMLATHVIERLSALGYREVLLNQGVLQQQHLYTDQLGTSDLLVETIIQQRLDDEFSLIYVGDRPDFDYLLITVMVSWGEFQEIGDGYYYPVNWDQVESIQLSNILTASTVSEQGDPSLGNLLFSIVQGLF